MRDRVKERNTYKGILKNSQKYCTQIERALLTRLSLVENTESEIQVCDKEDGTKWDILVQWFRSGVSSNFLVWSGECVSSKFHKNL